VEWYQAVSIAAEL